jgi:hypothetical protein
MTELMVECVGYIACGGRWAGLVVWGYGLTVFDNSELAEV